MRKHDIGREKLGRLAPTLLALPTVIWHTPLEYYMQYSVSEIRQLKTHGEKRVRVVLEVFYIAHEILADAGTRQDHRGAVRAASSSCRWSAGFPTGWAGPASPRPTKSASI